MNTFNHTVIGHGIVKVKRVGRTLRIAIDDFDAALSRITVEIGDGDLIVIDDESAALPRQHPANRQARQGGRHA